VPPLDPAAVRVINAHIAADAAIRARVEQFVTTLWGGLGTYRDSDIARFVRALLPVVLGAQRQIAALTDSYLATLASAVLGGPARPAGISPAAVTGEALRGVAPSEVYARPGVTVWTALSKGASLSDAIEQGKRRALNIAMTDLQLARTHTARKVMSRDDRITGHRRVLTGREDCGLCVVASTQRYHRAELQPIHPGCDCDVAPIYGANDPGQVVDEGLLEQAHTAIQERFGKSDRGGRDPIDYRKVLLVRDHGELGPLLTVKGQAFTGPDDI
jgi:hypothetical protein